MAKGIGGWNDGGTYVLTERFPGNGVRLGDRLVERGLHRETVAYLA